MEAGSWEEEWGQVPLWRQGSWNMGRRKVEKSSLRRGGMCILRRWGNAKRISYGKPYGNLLPYMLHPRKLKGKNILLFSTCYFFQRRAPSVQESPYSVVDRSRYLERSQQTWRCLLFSADHQCQTLSEQFTVRVLVLTQGRPKNKLKHICDFIGQYVLTTEILVTIA